MRTAAFVTLAIAVLSVASVPTHGADGLPPALRGAEAQTRRVEEVRKELLVLGTRHGIEPVVDALVEGGYEVDTTLLVESLKMLNQLLATEEGRTLLSQLQHPHEVFKLMAQLHKAKGGDGSLDVLVDFSRVMERVLTSNVSLRAKLLELIGEGTGNKISEKSLQELLVDVASSDVLKELKEEVELQSSKAHHVSEGSGDMSR